MDSGDLFFRSVYRFRTSSEKKFFFLHFKCVRDKSQGNEIGINVTLEKVLGKVSNNLRLITVSRDSVLAIVYLLKPNAWIA